MSFEEKDDDNNNDDTETPDPAQAQIPSHPGIKYPVMGIPPSDFQTTEVLLLRKSRIFSLLKSIIK